jgi:predicted nucleotidyltransferase
MTDLARLVTALAEAGVRFVIVGGMAGIAHGAARVTFDIDCVYARDADTITRLARAMQPFHPVLRGAPPGLPFRFDEPTITAGLNFTLDTSVGPIDFLGEVAGGGRYEALITDAVELHVFGVTCRVVSLEKLIALKRAAGRPKDYEAIAELESLREERGEA